MIWGIPIKKRIIIASSKKSPTKKRSSKKSTSASLKGGAAKSRLHFVSGDHASLYGTDDAELFRYHTACRNMLEHMVPFLASMWMAGIFGDATWAAMMGHIYTAARTVYPLAYRNGWLYVSTMPCYFTTAALLISAVSAVTEATAAGVLVKGLVLLVGLPVVYTQKSVAGLAALLGAFYAVCQVSVF
jgi:uncharacterized MAPEG superfamily protein